MNDQVSRYFNMSLDELEEVMLSNFKSQEAGKYEGNVGDPHNPDRAMLDKILGAIRNRLNATPAQFHTAICHDLRYCERRTSEEVTIAIGIAETALFGSFGLWFPPLTLAVYAIRKKLLDPFCRCT